MIYFEIVLGSYRRIVKRVQIDLIYICVYLSHSVIHLFVTSWTVAHQAPLSMGFSRQEYCNELPFPSPGDLPDPGIEPGSPTFQADSLPSEPPGKPHIYVCVCICVYIYIYITFRGAGLDIYIYTHTHIYVYIYVYDYTHTYIHIYVIIYTHTHIYEYSLGLFATLP